MYFTLAYRTVVMFAAIHITMRILGKRQMGQLELNELVVAIMLSEIAVSPITNPDHRLLMGLVPVLVLLICELVLSYTCMKSIKVRTLILGRPSIIVQDGKVNQKEMRKNRMTLTELAESLRGLGHADIATIKYAILEVGGKLSVLPLTAHAPATHQAHQLQVEENGLPQHIISDGRVMDKNLKNLGLDRNWLDKQLRLRGVSHPREVYLLSVDENHNIYFATKEEG